MGLFDITGDLITGLIRERSATQGHTLTGKFEAGLSYEVAKTAGGWEINGYDAAGVGKYLDKSTPGSRIPYSPGSGAVRSAFIDGLKRYAELRFNLNEKEALRAAFAMAVTMKREGKPTKNSFKYSSNGKRTGVITDTINENWEKIQASISSETGGIIDSQVQILLKEWQ